MPSLIPVLRPLSPLLTSVSSAQLAQMVYTEDEATKVVFAMSQFVAELLVRHVDWLAMIQKDPPKADEWKQYKQWLSISLQSCQTEIDLMRELRLFRQYIMVRICWAQTLQLYSTEHILHQLSELAECLIIAARDWLYQTSCRDLGTPTNQQGEAQPLLILGMGKLGGGELNFSSDIDLIFVFPESGSTQGGRRELDNNQFFTRLGQKIIKVLDQTTVDGFVYRVDMRLRPFGDSGPLVMSFSAFEDYYQEQGRDWERYAMVKARILGQTDKRYCQELQDILRPFVFRRYIDFSVIQSLRNMKSMIAREVRRRGLHDNIKLGAGGIREIEFIVQVFQLIRGGREKALQQRSLLATLTEIDNLALLEHSHVITLRKNYLFLRRLENLLQAIDDKQTQTLPTNSLDQARLAWGMEFSDWLSLKSDVDKRMLEVRTIFNDMVDQESYEQEDTSPYIRYACLWFDQFEQQDLINVMPNLSEETCLQVGDIIKTFRQDIEKRPIGQRGRQVLDQLMPRLFAMICSRDDALITLTRLCHLLSNIITRTTYLELLFEYPSVLAHLIRLCAASPMIASQLARYPILLDELLDPATLYRPIPLDAYKDELRQYLLRIPDDEEQLLEALRQFKQAQLLRIAAADISGELPVMKVSDHLTYLAEAIIDAVVQIAWQQMTQRYGQPIHIQQRQGRGFAIVAYGKLGGIELGYGSDLDLVFIIDSPPDSVTDGHRSINASHFYQRLTQRIIHLFSTRTSSGVLYEVDARLRPSGESGLLVTTINAFAQYQRNEAWTWEHQAMVRSRMVYNDQQLRDQFNSIRHEVLCRPRQESLLRQEVSAMREKMRDHLANHDETKFDLKRDAGGITDIEFIAQYLVLRFAHQQPELTRWSDNVRIFELMAHYKIMSENEAKSLISAYVTLRDEIHHLTLQERPGKVAATEFMQLRTLVKSHWQHWLEEPTLTL